MLIDKEGNLIAFLITMPSFSRALKKLTEIDYLIFPSLKFYFNDRVSLYLIEDPKFQNKGNSCHF